MAAALCFVSLAACESNRPAPAPDVDTAVAAGAAATSTTGLTAGGEPAIPPVQEFHFDPGAKAVGDTVLGLRIAARDVNRVFEDSVWVGNIRFAGELTLTGVYQPHFDYPEPSALCFHVTDSTSVRRIPQFKPDAWTSASMKRWFCFTNTDEARTQLGPPEQPIHATIVVDDFTLNRQFTDSFSTAKLVRVTTKGGNATRTLRE